MNRIELCKCPTCGYVWTKGRNGSHSCPDLMAATIKELTSQNKKLREMIKYGVGEKDMEQDI